MRAGILDKAAMHLAVIALVESGLAGLFLNQ